MSSGPKNDLVWRALAASTRREILDLLAAGPRTTGDLCAAMPHLCRTAVMKHIDTLAEAGLVLARRDGRLRWNYLNPVPIQQVCDRWVSRHVRGLASSLARLEEHVESGRTVHPPKEPLPCQ